MKMIAFLPIVNMIFQPLEQFLDQAESDETMDTINGQVVLNDALQGGYVEMTEATQGLIDFFEILQRRKGQNMNLDGLKKLLARIKYDAPITPLEVQDAKKSVKRMRQVMTHLKVSECMKLFRDTSIKHRIERL